MIVGGSLFFRLHQAPDFARAHYASVGLNGVEGALAALDQSLKPLHRLCLSLGMRMHWLIAWQPSAASGERMTVALGFSGPDDTFARVEKVLSAMPLWVAFGASPRPDQPGNLRHSEDLPGRVFAEGVDWHGVQLRKSDRFREPIQFNAWVVRDNWAKDQGLPKEFQTVPAIEANQQSRLVSLLRLLPALNEPAIFSVTMEPADLAARLLADYEPSLEAFREFGTARFSLGLGRARHDLPTEDKTAEDIRRDRDETIDLLRETPHVLASIQCWSPDLATAQIMAETVLAEAVESGDCIAAPLSAGLPAFLLSAAAPLPTPSPDASRRGLGWLPYVFTLDELSGFFRLPALHDGETIELPKETDPPSASAGSTPALVLGRRMGLDESAAPLTLPLCLLSKHALVAGVPGSGKTNTLMALAHQVKRDHGVPYLILEPAKREYRGLLRIDPGLVVFSPGRVVPGVAPGRAPSFRINPFQIPASIPLAEHLANLQSAFEGAFPLFVPLPALVERAMLAIYRRWGWSLDSVSQGPEENRPWPTMSQFVAALTEVAEKTGYAGENMATLRGAIDTRFRRLVRGESLVGDVFDCDVSTLAPESWLKQSAVIELESLGPSYANFLTLILLSLLREVLGAKPERKLRHLLVLEEAHNLIGPQALATSGENASPKDAATAYVVKLLAEVRALGQGIVIADQLPSVLAPEVLKNTGLKLCHRLLAQDDRQMMGGTMMASEANLEAIGLLGPGQALAFHEALQKPIFTRIDLADAGGRHLDDLPDDASLALLMKEQRKQRRNLAC